MGGFGVTCFSLDLIQEADKNDNQEDLNKGVMTQASVMFIRFLYSSVACGVTLGVIK